jgi:hypothetical protein
LCSNGKVPVVGPDTPMPAVLVELTSKGCGCVLVADDAQRLCGIFTDGDLRRTLQQCGEQGRDVMALRVAEAMSREPKACSSIDMAVDAMQVGAAAAPLRRRGAAHPPLPRSCCGCGVLGAGLAGWLLAVVAMGRGLPLALAPASVPAAPTCPPLVVHGGGGGKVSV